MSKIGVSFRVDVTKIDKSRLFKGGKGTYLDLTGFIDLDLQDQYGNNGFISQSVNKEEREQGIQTPILGNSKVFFKDGGQSQQQGYKPQPASPSAGPDYGQGGESYEDDVPFAPHEKNSII
jgi:hypothetical protein